MGTKDIKTCTKCKQEKDPATDFDKHPRGHNGISSICKECRRKKARRLYLKNNADRSRRPPKLSDEELSFRNAEGARKWRESLGEEEYARRRAENYKKNREKILLQQRAGCAIRREQIAARNKAWREKNQEYARQKQAEWRAAHPDYNTAEARRLRAEKRASAPQKPVPVRMPREKKPYTQRRNEYAREKGRTDPNAHVCRVLRTRLSKAVRGEVRSGSAVRDLGCSVEQLREYLEAQFYPHPLTGEEMTWANHTSKGWHIDHVVPLAAFDLTDPEQLKAACHFTNLQPMWWFENQEKKSRDARTPFFSHQLLTPQTLRALYTAVLAEDAQVAA